MEFNIWLFGDGAFITSLGLFLMVIVGGLVVKLITILWKLIPFLG